MITKRIAAASAIALCAVALGGCWTNHNGEKVGMITKLSKVGAYWPTWEAEIIRGGFNGGTGVNGAAFDFTIEDNAMAEKLRVAMENQQEVKIHYHGEVFVSPWRSEGHTFLDSIDSIGKPQATLAQPAATGSLTAVADAPPLPAADRLKVIAAIVNQNQQLIDMLKAEEPQAAK